MLHLNLSPNSPLLLCWHCLNFRHLDKTLDKMGSQFLEHVDLWHANCNILYYIIFYKSFTEYFATKEFEHEIWVTGHAVGF